MRRLGVLQRVIKSKNGVYNQPASIILVATGRVNLTPYMGRAKHSTISCSNTAMDKILRGIYMSFTMAFTVG